MPAEFSANGRRYTPPDQPIAVLCIDGCADEYLSVSISRGCMPRLAAMARDGYRGLVRGVVPSFTNVNNTSIVTGVAPAVHGIAGNFFLERRALCPPRSSSFVRSARSISPPPTERGCTSGATSPTAAALRERHQKLRRRELRRALQSDRGEGGRWH